MLYLGQIVELAQKEDLIENPLHPYTKALISSIPEVNPEGSLSSNRIILKGGNTKPCKSAIWLLLPHQMPGCNWVEVKQKTELREVKSGHYVAYNKKIYRKRGGYVMSMRWGKIGQFAVQTLTKVRPNENVLVLADTWTDVDAAKAFLSAVVNGGAKGNLLFIEKTSQTDTSDLSTVAAGAIKGADVIIGICQTRFIEKGATRIARENGTRIISVQLRGVEDFVINSIVDVDYTALIMQAKKIVELWQKTDICHVTSEIGTDISFSFKENTNKVRPVGVGDGVVNKPGEVGYFPGVDVNIAPVEDTINGVMVVDGAIAPGNKLVDQPITLKIEKGIIKSIEGGMDAANFKAALESVKHPAAFAMCHFTLGLNPIAKPSNNMAETEHIYGAVTCGFGNQVPAFEGSVGECPIHSDVVLLSTTITLDGKVLFCKNKINPEWGI